MRDHVHEQVKGHAPRLLARRGPPSFPPLLPLLHPLSFPPQANSPGTSSGKEHNWRKLSKGYALRTVLALQVSRGAGRGRGVGERGWQNYHWRCSWAAEWAGASGWGKGVYGFQ